MNLTVEEAIAKFGAKAKEKLANPATTGRPEDQLRSPFEQLLADIADLVNLSTAGVVAVDESTLAVLKTRPDYSITVKNALVGFVELKAPGKGADPRKFRTLTTKSSGKSFVRYRTSSIRTEIHSACGRTVNWSARFVDLAEVAVGS